MEVGRRKRGGGKGVRSKEWFDNLIVCLLFHPASGVSAQDEFADLIVNKDEETVRERTKPPAGLEGVHPESHIHAWGVG